MLTGETLQKLLDVLRETAGYFVFRDKAGEEYVLARKEDFMSGESAQGADKQLSLPPLRSSSSAGQATTSLVEAVRKTARQFDTTPEFVLDSINKEIANYHEEERERELDDLSVEAAGQGRPLDRARGKGKRIRFEPIHGDLPPELQE
ncbi:MAG: hypothetical protein AAB538_03780 [Patescibacteria group bacterium]